MEMCWRMCVTHCVLLVLSRLNGAAGTGSDSATVEISWLKRSNWRLDDMGHFAHHGKSNPYHPSPIYDPTSDIDCAEDQCSNTTHCKDFPERICREYTPCHTKICLHKDFWPSIPPDFALFFTMFFIAVAAGATGIGGGGLNVPMLMIWSRFSIKEAVPLSHAGVMGNSLVMLFWNAPQRHPACARRPLIDYELALLLLPAMLAGSNLGVIVGRVLPSTVLIVLALVVLLFATFKSTKKGLSIGRVQRAARSTNQPASGALPRVSSSALPHASIAPVGVSPGMPSPPRVMGADGSGPDTGRGAERFSHWPTLAPEGNGEEPVQRTWSGGLMHSSRKQSTSACGEQLARRLTPLFPLQREPMRVPWTAIGLMVLCNVLFTIDILAMKEDVTGVKMCTAPYWCIFIVLYPLALLGIKCGAWSLRKLARWHEEQGDGVIEGDPEVNLRTLTLYPFLMGAIGLVAGLLGLGGGEFMVPLLLEIGLPTRVAAATSGFLMVFTTASNIIHYFVGDIMQHFLGYGTTMFLIAAFGGLLGLVLRDTSYLQANSYLVVFLLAAMLFLGGVLLMIRGLFQSLIDFAFHPFCN